ncbi:protein spaetzle 5 isoform X2 [Aethina tumida]|uniref:protein spaetzle 5 isoform X2 n=1 Tax=Aethina tumida TaxID=116153 RepID=UPI00096B2B2E|nr:protein spaetzle 5 isoform X2 [Aethina tumida]
MIVRTIWTLILYTAVECHTGCSPLYGHEPCSFLPAPPGKTPPCARPGHTYCEYPDHYPGRLIHYLIQKWRYDHTSYLSDETKEEFSSYIFPQPKPEYGPPGYQSFGPNGINGQQSFVPEPIYIPKPQHPIRLDDNGYLPQQNFSAGVFNGFPDNNNLVYQEHLRNGQYYTYKYSNNFPQVNRPDYGAYYYDQPQQYSNQVWKRKAEVKYGRLKRSLRFKRSQQILDKNFQNLSSNKTLTIERRRRQANLSGEPLCRSRSQFIMPRAALNNKGNWMYIVNMPEVDNRYTQLVRSESCVSQTCSSICSLPAGYTSRCEQKYIQKRLVALEGGGNQLYTDVFWFPSCCVCTLSNS